MSVDKVQLQQQEIVNNDVVLTDINPITTTNSVFDPSSGSSMQETLDRLWNSINSQLARVVNSVNDKTGAVVINPGDIGLGNVDNVSFNDIKEWVVDYFKKAMANYQFRLYDTLDDAELERQTNDKTLDSVPFYTTNGFLPDKKSYIGYFYWNEDNEELEYNYKSINTVGSTNASLSYDENGHLEVKIHPDEEALYLDDEDPTKQGLRIRPDKFASEMLSSPCMYGDRTKTDTLLAVNEQARTTEGIQVHISIDGEDIPYQEKNNNIIPFYLHINWRDKLKLFTQVITEFKGLYIGEYDSGTSPVPAGDYAVFALMNRQPAIGVVTRIPDVEDETPYYEIKFNTIKTFTSGMGIGYLANHMNGQIGHQLVVDMYENVKSDGLSGLAAKASGLLPTDPSETQGVQSDLQDLAYRPTAPYGATRFTNTPYRGLVVATDDTICRYPIHRFNPSGETHVVTETVSGTTTSENEYNGSEYAENWSPIAYYGFKEDARYTGDLAPDGLDNGYVTSTSYLSVNANKLVRDANFEILTDDEAPSDWNNIFVDNYYYASSIGTDDYLYEKINGRRPPYQPGLFARKRNDQANFHLTNISGLRTTHFSIDKSDPIRIGEEYSELTDNELKSLGIYDRKDSLGNDIPLYPFNMFSGGISVNTGNFLEICPKETTYGIDYDDSGKVNVRIGKGLTDDYVLEQIDLTRYDMTHAPEDFNEHPDLFLLKNDDGTFVPIPEEWKYYKITNRPEDWDTNYYDYFIKYVIVDPETSVSVTRFIQIQKQHGVPDFPPKDHDNNPYEVWKIDESVLWFNTFNKVAMSLLYEGLYKKTRNNRIAVSSDQTSITFDSNNRIKVNGDESLRVTGEVGHEKLKAFPVARPVVNRHYYPGEIFSNEDRDILFVVKDEEGVDVNDNLDQLIAGGKISVFRQTSGGGSSAVVGLRKFAHNTTYAENEIIECTDDNVTYLVRVIKVGGLETNASSSSKTYVNNHELKPITPIRDSNSIGVSTNGTNMFYTKIDGNTIDDGDNGLHVKVDGRTIQSDSSTGLTIPIDGSTIYYDTASNKIKANSGGGGGVSGVNVDNKSLAIGSNNTLYAKLGDTLWLGSNGNGPIEVDYDHDTLCVTDEPNEPSRLSVYRGNIIDNQTIKLDDAGRRFTVRCDGVTTYATSDGVTARPIVDFISGEQDLYKGQLIGIGSTNLLYICVATRAFHHTLSNTIYEIADGDLVVLWERS